MRDLNVAIVGATGAVGECLRHLLEERDFPLKALHLLASARSAGESLSFKGLPIDVQDLTTFDFNGIDVAFFSAGGQVSEQYVPIAAAAGALVIDNTSQFRQAADVPLVVPEVNVDLLCTRPASNIIANPNCSTIQMLVALKPLHDLAQLQAAVVSTYQAVSGSGAKAVQTLASQARALLSGENIEPQVYPQLIAFNALPHIDVFLDNGYSKEEMKMLWETRKILADDGISVNATAVRVPVFYGHSESIHARFAEPLLADQARLVLRDAPGVCVIDNLPELAYPTPLKHAAGNDDVYVGRIRQDLADPCALNLWVVADNVRKGAALNAVQIAEACCTWL